MTQFAGYGRSGDLLRDIGPNFALAEEKGYEMMETFSPNMRRGGPETTKWTGRYHRAAIHTKLEKGLYHATAKIDVPLMPNAPKEK